MQEIEELAPGESPVIMWRFKVDNDYILTALDYISYSVTLEADDIEISEEIGRLSLDDCNEIHFETDNTIVFSDD